MTEENQTTVCSIDGYARIVLQDELQSKINTFGRLLESHYQAQRNVEKTQNELKNNLQKVRELAATLDVKPELQAELIASVEEVLPTFQDLESFIDAL